MNTLALTGHSLVVSLYNTMTLDAAALGNSTSGVEDSLVSRLRAGEIAAVGEAYDAHHEAVRRFARRLVGDDAAAEDLVHEVFLQLSQLIRKFRGDSNLRTFLISVSVNHARHYVRAASRRRAAAERAALEEVHLAQPSEQRPDRALERRQLAAILTRALDRLSLDHRVTFVLCEVEGRTSREAATIVGAPEGTVRTRLLYAKRQLRALVEAEGLS